MKKFNKKRKSNKGFTLVELIVVIAILAVLAVGAVLAYSNIATHAEQAALRADTAAVIRALNTFNALETRTTHKVIGDNANPTKLTQNGIDVTEGILRGLKVGVLGLTGEISLGITIDDGRLKDVIPNLSYDSASHSFRTRTPSS